MYRYREPDEFERPTAAELNAEQDASYQLDLDHPVEDDGFGHCAWCGHPFTENHENGEDIHDTTADVKAVNQQLSNRNPLPTGEFQ